MKLTKITRKGLIEEINAITKFNYEIVHEKWIEFCKARPNGNQSLEELSMLVTSLTDINPWRVIVTKEEFQKISKAIKEAQVNIEIIFETLKKVITQNELVSGDA